MVVCLTTDNWRIFTSSWCSSADVCDEELQTLQYIETVENTAVPPV